MSLIAPAVFVESGPERCSGLPVMRYGPDSLHAALGEDLLLIRHASEHHITPGGAVQAFNFTARGIPRGRRHIGQ
ncbi:hypothetical protein TVNIR_1699 [Thioalkalivibrio nitratireducens DSM 14787]|uniref:Uncharacterized protein n=1 Tax=Thioalkalivibrio nitratireducens (strain DSM 14787 / UNIQEM 213 / ALEN2) TaxID=1255043 RepID=L0DWI5_THIND|nr:hypothetical protein TVNIR_1699 [Thioalkalivibrio nitratireducens DSM 14787]